MVIPVIDVIAIASVSAGVQELSPDTKSLVRL
jgi:hypothetical protein